MTKVQIKFAPSAIAHKLYFMDDCVEFVQDNIAFWEPSKPFEINTGSCTDNEAIADEVFDITNNPNRQDEREYVYGRGRSLSSGDIVVVNNEQWLCRSFGWSKL